MKYKKTVLTFFVTAIILCGTFSASAQQLPEIIWDKVAQRPITPGFSATHSIKFSSDGQRIFAGGSKRLGDQIGSITTFAAADGTELAATPTYAPIPQINELALSLDGQRLATAHNVYGCYYQINCLYSYILYDSLTLNRVSEPKTTFYASQSVDYSPNGQLVAVGDYSPGNNIKILNPIDLSVLRTLPGHSRSGGGRTMSVRFSPDGQTLASGGGDGKVKFWRVSDGSLIRSLDFDTPFFEVFSVAFSPDGQYLAATDRSTVSKVKIWRVAGGTLVKTFTNPEYFSYPSHKVTWTRDGRYVVTNFELGNDPSRIRFWNFATGELAREYVGATINDSIKTVEFSPDGRTFAFSYGSHVILARNPFAPTNTAADFDGDGRSDPSVYRGGNWYMQQSTDGFAAARFGSATDKITPTDFDGDGRTDIAVFRDGFWYWLNSSSGIFNAVQFGQAGDIPVPADYSGDERAELAVYRGGVWYILNPANNQSNAIQFGIASDKPVPADYDGDGKTDAAVYREGVWYVRRSAGGLTGLRFGIASDKPVVGDYDGDGKADQAVYRNGVWYILGSRLGSYAIQFGASNDIPAAADYDGDGRTDAAVFRNGIWYMLRSQQGFGAVQFGAADDKPIPAAFVP